MSKSAAISNKEMETATVNEWYEFGRNHYLKGVDLEEANGDQNLINKYWWMGAKHFWDVLALGHPQAPYSLSLCFHLGTGVKENKEIAQLLFGTALKLKDAKCQDYIDEIIPPSEMDKSITNLYNLIKETQLKIDINAALNVQQMAEQVNIFDQFFNDLPYFYGLTMTDHFINQENNEDHDDTHSPQSSDLVVQQGQDVTQQQDVQVSGAASQPTNDDSSCCCVIF
jgi:hypothetical protein